MSDLPTQKLYSVALTVTETHNYTIEARSTHEAETIAEQMFQEGDDGSLSDSMLEVVDSYPIEDAEVVLAQDSANDDEQEDMD